MNFKQRFPFRFGTTSYIIADEIIPNIEYLKDKVDDIELVLFESDEFSNLPSEADIRKLNAFAEEADLTYSVHLPLDVYLGHSDRKERERSAAKCLRVIDCCRDLPKSAFVIHFEAGNGIDINAFTCDERQFFADRLRESVSMLLRDSGEEAASFCAENLNYPFELVWPVVDEYGLSVTLDVGHLEFYGFPAKEHLEQYFHRTKVLHMHGTLEGKDHNSLAYMNPETLGLVMNYLHENPVPQRVFTMEIFSEDDFRSSCKAVECFSW